ncbi:MAG TPA: class I SAM-dependent methyltransferase [Steroidobacteraceae bacterium]|nr:class I SAM-dependent methyltransferase [Steroidobacteraceae bacterium]
MVDLAYSDARLAALYDRLYPRPPSFDFYLPMMMGARAVLDVGCGTGTLLHEARRCGHAGRLCGLDPAAGMLAQARARTDIEWICGDLLSVGWVSEFDLVLMTGHAFQVLLTDAGIRAALGAIRTALRETGIFAFDTRNPAARAWEHWIPQNAVEVVDEQAEKVRLALQVEIPFDGRTVTFTETFTARGWDRPRVSRSTLRFLEPPALAALLSEAGFAIEVQFGDFGHQPLAAASPEIITIARAC